MIDIEALVDYAAEDDPDFRNRLKGAAPGDIARLEAFAGFPLPGSYRFFLERMGADAGGLKLQAGCRTEPSAVLALHERLRENPFPLIPKGTILIGAGNLGELILDPRKTREPEVCLYSEGELARRVSESLEKLLFRRVFQAHIGRRSNRADLEGQNVGPRLLEAAARLRAAGFETLWFSERDVILARSREALVRLQANPPAMFAEIGAQTPKALAELVESLGRFGLAPG